MAGHKANRPAVKTTYDNLVFRAYGETAIVTGQTTASIAGPSAQRVLLRFTDVLVRRGGKWLVVTSHATRVSN
jgi:ketosteroid isomerase-like protein